MDRESKTVKLNVCREESDFASAVTKFIAGYGDSFIILYAPKECLLLKLGKDGKFKDQKGETQPKDFYEARVFNAKAEMRWLKDENQGIAVTISETEIEAEFGGDVLLTNSQQYLLWGEISPTNDAKNNGEWTELAEARIGKFCVPIKTTSRACFTATEYLKSYGEQDGNVAVFEERLTGIKPYPTETKGGKTNAD
jgi:CRISPR-associated protein (TIGR03984 family)